MTPTASNNGLLHLSASARSCSIRLVSSPKGGGMIINTSKYAGNMGRNSLQPPIHQITPVRPNSSAMLVSQGDQSAVATPTRLKDETSNSAIKTGCPG